MLTALAGIFFWMFGASPAPAQVVTVYPPEASGPLTNPLMGFRPGLDSYASYPYPTVIQQYIPWSAIENHESDSVQKIRDFCNAQWANLPANNVKVIPRVYIDWDWNTGNEHWPSDLTTGDWSSQQFKDRVVRLVGRLGEVWNHDPRVAWVQTGLISYWGEQENPVGIHQDGWGQRLGDAFTAAFPNKKFVVRNMGAWPGYNTGVYWDSFGHPGQRPWAWTEIININNQGRYLTQVVEGETALNWGVEGEFASLYGAEQKTDSNGNTYWEGSADITLSNSQYTDNMIDVIRELHCSALGWIAGYSPNNPTVQVQAARMQKEFGYRFHITEFSCDARTDPGTHLNLQFKVKNKGSAPFYENWPLAVVLIDKNTRQLLWKTTIPNVDIRKWQPGSDYSYTTRTYQTPPQEHLVSASIPLPANLPVGEHLIGVTVLEPLSRTPGLFFAVPNFFKESQTQPLCKIGIGMDAASHTLDGVIFDDLVSDDTRFYTMTPQGPNYTLTVEPSGFGRISQASATGSYPKDTGVEVRASGRVGYTFSSWGGALTGTTTNPAIIGMDANKSISANYVPVATHLLSMTSTNGSITLSPPGGIYNAGTAVTVTTTPSSGYTFSSWGGDLSGSASSTTITMTGDKNISANFIVPPVTGPASFGINCGSSSPYTAGDGVVFAADGIWNSGGNSYDVGPRPISNTPDGTLHLSNRWGGTFGYNIPLATGNYEVTLIFSEIYFNEAGRRVFNVALEGSQVIGNLDVFSLVGANAAYEQSRIVSVNDGALNIAFSSLADNANISAIKVTRTPRPDSFTLESNSTNGAVTFDPPVAVHDAGSVATVTAIPSHGYSFDSWSGDLSGSGNPATVTMNANQSVIANFSAITAYSILTANATHGAISPEPFGGVYYPGTTLTLTPQPAAGYKFESWGGDLSGTSQPATITMTADKNVTANFVPIPTYILTTSAENGSLTLNPPSGTYEEGTVVTVAVTPAVGYKFESWGGDLSGTTHPTIITMTADKSVTANFVPIPDFTLTTNVTNGSLTLTPPGGVYPEGTVVNVTVTPASGYELESWAGDLSGNANPTPITMDGNKSVTAALTNISGIIDTSGSPIGAPKFLATGKKYIGDGYLTARRTPGTDIQLSGWGNEFAMTGGLFTIEAGVEVTNTWGVYWTHNKSDMRIDGIYDISNNPESETRVDALTGSGSINFHQQPWVDAQKLHVGLDNGSGTFSGTIQGVWPWSGSGVNITKSGIGTQTFDNLANQPIRTILINTGAVELSNPVTAPARLGTTISGAGNLNKSGPGLLTLSGSLGNTGVVTVSEGTLGVSTGLSALSNLVVAPGAVLKLNFSGEIVVNSLALGSSGPLPGGLYHSGHPTYGAFFTGSTGSLRIIGSDFDAWAMVHGISGGPSDDDDKDGRTNREEYAFALLPNNGSSSNPISVPFSHLTGTFSYTRRNSALTAPLAYTVWYSTSLEAGNWMKDAAAVQGTPVLNGDIETVPVTISPSLLTHPKLFIQVRAE